MIFLGGAWLEAVVCALVEAGKPTATPVAVIISATCAQQVTILGTVGDIAQRVWQALLDPPMLILVGEVTSLSVTLNWFERRNGPSGISGQYPEAAANVDGRLTTAYTRP